ncbi:MAG: hypothetical protein ACKOZW_00355 [Cyanobium sp.]
MGGRSGVGDRRNGGTGGPARPRPGLRWRQLLLVPLLCFALLLPWPGLAGRALAISWPGRAAPAIRPESLGVASAQRLQEVPPPAAVQQLQEALAERAPHVRILAPAADAVLPGEPWSLRLQVDDWPLVDGGSLGLGPHLLVLIDGEEPIRLTGLEATLPPLRPGSHRLTVVAARPWGEAVKSPGAMAQIRLHRTAPNPPVLPALGSPQLLPVSPPAAAPSEPLLLDWLLVDAPLQHLRDDDARWRLRVSVNGDSFLVDRQTPLWLRGWRPGSNAVQLELLDGRGEALNAPFNSLVQEVRLDPLQPRPAWQGGRLSPSDLAILLGQAPAAPAAPDSGAASLETDPPEAAANQDDTPPAAAPEEVESLEPDSEEPDTQAPEAEEPPSQATEGSKEPGAASAIPNDAPTPEAMAAEEAPVPIAEDEEAATAGSQEATPAPPTLRPAREEVNADGTLRREPRRGPLAGLRERLAG